jgi:hypothetical protein
MAHKINYVVDDGPLAGSLALCVAMSQSTARLQFWYLHY